MAEVELERLRRREAELEAEMARLRADAGGGRALRHWAIFESAVDFAIIATDRDGRITDWNTGAERILGWSAAEMRGEPASRFFTPEDRAEDRAGFEMRRSLEAGHAADERWHMKKDGSRFWASGEMMPLRGEDGAHLGFLKILRDRTEQRRTEDALRASEERLLLALEAGGLGAWELDLANDRAVRSPRHDAIFGYAEPPAEWGYAAFMQHVLDEDRAAVD